ncbi:hypothetical protein TPA0910_46980 [Streptomyces hygroscopicus subsp. sporocinereus]|uniref:Uncharacterized protein n=1 Tax=Streptomyces hygroscopicus TaxID=1912 RepID=A0ABQ3U3S4_STRHY|nr:hypothetical protein TPA0910_46980 [Streptomyces hygroscopicus]
MRRVWRTAARGACAAPLHTRARRPPPPVTGEGNATSAVWNRRRERDPRRPAHRADMKPTSSRTAKEADLLADRPTASNPPGKARRRSPTSEVTDLGSH